MSVRAHMLLLCAGARLCVSVGFCSDNLCVILETLSYHRIVDVTFCMNFPRFRFGSKFFVPFSFIFYFWFARLCEYEFMQVKCFKVASSSSLATASFSATRACNSINGERMSSAHADSTSAALAMYHFSSWLSFLSVYFRHCCTAHCSSFDWHKAKRRNWFNISGSTKTAMRKQIHLIPTTHIASRFTFHLEVVLDPLSMKMRVK